MIGKSFKVTVQHGEFVDIDGILYTGPVADLISAVVALLMALFEFKAMRKLENSLPKSNELIDKQ